MAVGTALSGCGGGGSSSAASDAGSATASAPSSGASVSSGPPPAVLKAQQANTAVDPQIVAADNAFGLNVLNQLTSADTGNIAISPISIAMALQIVYNGAAGTTQTAMAQTLALGTLSLAQVNDDNAALQASLINPDSNVQLTIANSLWMHLSDNPVAAAFTTADQTYYGATIGDLAGAPDNVNAWVAAQTNGLITQILPTEPAGYYAQLVALIANTVYFKGQWSATFDAGQTAAAPFTLSDGSQLSAQMMHREGSYAYFQDTLAGTAFQAIRVPYGTGRLYMLIVLPDSQTPLSSFVAGLTAATVSSWNKQFQSSGVSLSLPRFTATFGTSLNSALTQLGMGVAFCNAGASFPGISPQACIQDVEHKSVVEVDETGTVAAAATTIGVGVTAVQAPQYTMVMDHPFFYAIQDGLTGELLFVGVLMNPS